MTRAASPRGFTLMELQLALAVFLIVSAMSVAILQAALPSIRVDGQVGRVVGLLQSGRELAISRQRDIEVRFDPPSSAIDLVQIEGDGAEALLQRVVFEYGVTFRQLPGAGDTPDGFGADDLVDFGGAATLRFISDGTFVDGSSVPVNGTVFLGIDGRAETARAITLTGSTARARSYRWNPPGAESAGGWAPR